MSAIKVALVGATGATGSSIVKGLLQSTKASYEITALIRPSSIDKPAVEHLKQEGVKVVAADLEGPQDQLVKALQGQDVVVSAIYFANIPSEKHLANAAKAAGVGRFVPCFFATVAPPKGVMALRDVKEDSLNHVKEIKLPYTVIDVGWWYQITLPGLPSGRTDYAVLIPSIIVGDGDTPSALTDLGDVGRFVARILADPRTLNKMVFAYSEIYSQNQAWVLLEELSGEKIDRQYASAESILKDVQELKAKQDGLGEASWRRRAEKDYKNSWGLRGDNTPEYARYLGYLDAKDLYPDLKSKTLKEYIQELLDKKALVPYKS
ncbi:hypothetical protein F66182_7934 [Fusarium sp. NRRL 66182]|nr:hypothetical protein F66182_7934 [Fusarium sp. NRRL 66182]